MDELRDVEGRALAQANAAWRARWAGRAAERRKANSPWPDTDAALAQWAEESPAYE